MITQPKTQLLMMLLGISVLALSGCVTRQSEKTQVVYQCERGSVLNVTFAERGYTTIHGGKHYKKRYHEKPSVAIVSFGDNQMVTLTQEISGSGFIYSNGQYSLHGKGNEATWTVGKMIGEQCVAD